MHRRQLLSRLLQSNSRAEPTRVFGLARPKTLCWLSRVAARRPSFLEMKIEISYLTLESPLSSLKLALIAALSFCTTARSSAIVFEARTLRMNCFTVYSKQCIEGQMWRPYRNSFWQSKGPHWARTDMVTSWEEER
jgi:hypothetical protein